MTLSPSTRLGPYEIVSLLGVGGMGEVYRARDTRLGREVAIKVLPAELAADAERLARFEREARSASALSHPNIVAIYDVGTSNEVSYIAMELVCGAPLRDLLGAPLPVRRLLQIAVQIAEGLAKAHEAGIVHRDLKPENVMVSEDGLVKILDFGLAKSAHGSGALAVGSLEPTLMAPTEPGLVMGTVGYMSPEQARGATVDHRSDQFSLGAILYEMATGRRAFERGSAPETMTAVIREEPEPIGARNPSVPVPLRWTIERCLAKEARGRYAATEDLARELLTLRDRLSETSGSTPAPPEPMTSGAPVASRARWWVLPLAMVAVAALTATVAWWRWGRADHSPRNPLAGARFTRVTDWEGAELGGSISADGKFVAFLSDRDGQYDVWVQQLGSGEFLNITKGRAPGLGARMIRVTGFTDDGAHVWWPASTPDNGIVFQAPTMGGPIRPFPGRGRFLDMQLSPDRQQLLFMENTAGDPLFIGDARGNDAKQIYVEQPGRHNHFPTWSGDGRFVYFASGAIASELDVWRVPAGGGDAERLTRHSSVGHLTLLDARTLLYTADRSAGRGTGLWGFDLGREVSYPVSSGIEAFTSVAADRSGRRLVATVANSSRNLWSVPIERGRPERLVEESEVKRFDVGSVHAGSPRFGPGSVLYLSSRGGPDGLRKFDHGNDVELWDGRNGVVESPPAVSADGARICFTARREQRWQLYVMAGDGSGARPIAESLDVLGEVTMSPDGRWVAAVVAEGGKTLMYKIPVDGGDPVRLVESADGVIAKPVWSPDGALIAYWVSMGAQAEGLKVRAVTPDGEPFSLPEIGFKSLGTSYRFLPDGSALVVMKSEGVSPVARDANFWLVDLESGEQRQLTDFEAGYDSNAFDVSPDGTQILFDRYRENSDIVLIDLPAEQGEASR